MNWNLYCQMKLNKSHYILIIVSYLLLIIITIIFIKANHTCKNAILYINNKGVCQSYRINKNECKIKVKICGKSKGFYIVKYDNKENYINQNVVELIKFNDTKAK